MLRSVSRVVSRVLLPLSLLAMAPPAAAQDAPTDTLTATSALTSLQHQSEEVESGLADVRRRLMLLGVRGMDERGAARLVLTYEDHYVGLAPLSATFSLDGQRLFTSTDPARIEQGAIYAGAVPSGPHVLTLEMHYRGEMLYTTGYHVAITSSYAFDTTLDRTTRIHVIGHDTSLFAPPPDRWTVDYLNETDPVE